MAKDPKIVIRGDDRTGAAFKSARQNMARLGTAAVSLGGIVGGAVVVGAFAKMVKSTLDSVDALAKQADALGVSTKALAGLRLAGELSGVSTDAMDKSLQKFNRTLGDAISGIPAAVESFDRLNLSADELANMPADEAMARVADAMGQVETAAERAQIAQLLFGRSGVQMLNTLDLGAEGLREVSREAEALGLAISRADAREIEEAGDAMLRLSKLGTGFANQITVEIAPVLTALSDGIREAVLESGGMKQVALNVVDFGLASIETVAAVFEGTLKAVQFARDSFNSAADAIDKTYEDTLKPILVDLGIVEGGSAGSGPQVTSRIFVGMNGLATTIATVGGQAVELTGTTEEMASQLNAAADAQGILADQTDDVTSSLDKATEAFEGVRQGAQKLRASLGEEAPLVPGVDAPSPAAIPDDLVTGPPMVEFGPSREMWEQWREGVQANLDSVNESLLSDEESFVLHWEAKQATLDEALAEGLMSEEAYARAVERVNKARSDSDKKRENEDLARKARAVAIGLGGLAQLAEGAAAHNKSMFNVVKAARIGEAIVNTYAGATLALAQYPPPFGYIAAAGVIAAGMANVASISSASFGSSGGGGGGGGGGGSVPSVGVGGSAGGASAGTAEIPALADSAGPTRAPLDVNINLPDRNYSPEELRAIIDGINDQQEGGYRVHIASGLAGQRRDPQL